MLWSGLDYPELYAEPHKPQDSSGSVPNSRAFLPHIMLANRPQQLGSLGAHAGKPVPELGVAMYMTQF